MYKKQEINVDLFNPSPSITINKKLNLIYINNIDMNNWLEYLNNLEISRIRIKLIYKSI